LGIALDPCERLFDTGRGGVCRPAAAVETGRQDILKARLPEHTFKTPVPVVVRIVWEHDGEEQLETVALGWLGQKA
jgi:hypothetical protein